MPWKDWDDTNPIISPITRRLLLGNAAAANNRDFLVRFNVKKILSVLLLTDYWPDKDLCESLSIDHRVFPVADESFPENATDDLKQMLIEKVFPWIKNSEEMRKNVLVHCYASRSRSPSLVITYLMWKNGFGLESTLNMLYEHHPLANPIPDTLRSFLEAIGQRLPDEWYERKWIQRHREKTQ